MEPCEWEIRWNDSLNVGVPEIDQEHRQFVARVNDLNRAIVECLDKPAVERALDLMLMEAAHHFWHEQQLMARWNYPEREAHTAKHVKLIAQFERTMKEFESADVSFTWALKGLHIKQLLVDHLLQEDMKYRDFLQGRENPGKHSGRKRPARKRGSTAAQGARRRALK